MHERPGQRRPGNGLPRAGRVALWTLTASVLAGLAVLAFAIPPPEQDGWALPLYSSIVATWTVSGVFLATRRPDNRVGWIMAAAGIGTGLGLLGQTWAYLSITASAGALPLTAPGAILGLLFNPSLFLVMLVPLFFPDGRLMSRRWAPVAGVLLVSFVATLTGTLIRTGPMEGMELFDNPLGQPGLEELARAMIDLGGVGSLVCLPAGMVAAVLRFRRGTPVERRQLKWFGSALILAFSLFFGATLLPQPYGQAAWIGASLSLGLVPLAIGVAILRYRLYEIDRIVSRTISYGLLTALLATIFIGTNLAFQAVVAGATGESTLAVAASTLVVAGLFQPVRRRLQALIDRRFNRARSDAERLVVAFAAGTRNGVDLVDLRRSLESAATEVVHPAGLALWLRQSE